MAKTKPPTPAETNPRNDEVMRQRVCEWFARKRLKLSGGAADLLVDELGGRQLDDLSRTCQQLAAIATILYPKAIVGCAIQAWEIEAARNALIAAKGTEQSLVGSYNVPGLTPQTAASMRADPYRELQVQLYGLKARLNRIEAVSGSDAGEQNNEEEAREKIDEHLGNALCAIADLLHDRMQILADIGGEKSDSPV